MTDTPRTKIVQRWRWCIRCRYLFKDYPSRFCPFDNWYLSATPPPHLKVRFLT